MKKLFIAIIGFSVCIYVGCNGGGGRIDSISLPRDLRIAEVAESETALPVIAYHPKDQQMANNNASGNNNNHNTNRGASFRVENLNNNLPSAYQSKSVQCEEDEVRKGALMVFIPLELRSKALEKLAAKVDQLYLKFYVSFNKENLQMGTVTIEGDHIVDVVLYLGEEDHYFLFLDGKVSYNLSGDWIEGSFSFLLSKFETSHELLIKEGKFRCRL